MSKLFSTLIACSFLSIMFNCDVSCQSKIISKKNVPLDNKQDIDSKVRKMTKSELQAVEPTANLFIKRFRETRDFKVVFNEFFTKESMQVLRKSGFFRSINLSEKLIEELDDSILKAVYVAEMNIYYLTAVYDLAEINGMEDHSNQPLLMAQKELTKHNPLLSDDSLIINTRKELEKSLKEINEIVELYQKQITEETFNSPKYEEGVKRVSAFRKSVPSVSDNHNELGLKKATKIYTLEKDIFVFNFIVEKGQIKVLTLLIGD